MYWGRTDARGAVTGPPGEVKEELYLYAPYHCCAKCVQTVVKRCGVIVVVVSLSHECGSFGDGTCRAVEI